MRWFFQIKNSNHNCCNDPFSQPPQSNCNNNRLIYAIKATNRWLLKTHPKFPTSLTIYIFFHRYFAVCTYSISATYLFPSTPILCFPFSLYLNFSLSLLFYASFSSFLFSFSPEVPPVCMFFLVCIFFLLYIRLISLRARIKFGSSLIIRSPPQSKVWETYLAPG